MYAFFNQITEIMVQPKTEISKYFLINTTKQMPTTQKVCIIVSKSLLTTQLYPLQTW